MANCAMRRAEGRCSRFSHRPRSVGLPATVLTIWSSPTRMPPGSAYYRGRPPRSSGRSSCSMNAGSRPGRARFGGVSQSRCGQCRGLAARNAQRDRPASLVGPRVREHHRPALPYRPRTGPPLLAEQLARPVEFVAQIQSMYRWSPDFLEIGPDAKLTGLCMRSSRAPIMSPWRSTHRAAPTETSTIWLARSQPSPPLGMLLN